MHALQIATLNKLDANLIAILTQLAIYSTDVPNQHRLYFLENSKNKITIVALYNEHGIHY